MFCRLGAEDVTDDAVDALRIRWTNLFISDSSSFIRGVVRGERFARGNGSGGREERRDCGGGKLGTSVHLWRYCTKEHKICLKSQFLPNPKRKQPNFTIISRQLLCCGS